jgi:hypothetical protein
MFTVRTVLLTNDPHKPAQMRDARHATKRDALNAISRGGTVDTIRRIEKMYIVSYKKRQN